MRINDLNCIDPNKQTLVFDCDGVLLNYDKGLYQYMKSNNYDTSLIEDSLIHQKNWYDVIKLFNVKTVKQSIKKFEAFNRSDYAKNLEPYPDAMEFIKDNASVIKDNYNIVIVTAFSDSRWFSTKAKLNRIHNLETAFGYWIFDGIFFTGVNETKSDILKKINDASKYISLYVEDLPKCWTVGLNMSMMMPEFKKMIPTIIVRDIEYCGLDPTLIKSIQEPLRIQSLTDIKL